jgi:hypothetical protein
MCEAFRTTRHRQTIKAAQNHCLDQAVLLVVLTVVSQAAQLWVTGQAH